MNLKLSGWVLGLVLSGAAQAGIVRPTLHVLSVGLDRARCETFLYPEKDALDVAQVLKDFERVPGKASNYAGIEVELLRGRQVTAKNVKQALERLKAADPQDNVLVYLSGLATPESETSPYTFLTYRAPSPGGACNPKVPAPGLTLDDFQKAFRSLKVAHVLLIADTLSLGLIDTLELPVHSLALGIHEATEDESVRNGILTSGLLGTLKTYRTSKATRFSVMDLLAGAQGAVSSRQQLVVAFKGMGWDLFSGPAEK